MAKILPFRRIQQQAEKLNEPVMEPSYLDTNISAIMNDHSLTAANRHWLLENLLMDIDEQLEGYRKELERAERRLDALVRSAENDIASAYTEFETHVRGMTHAVRKLTKSARRCKDGPKSGK